MLFHALIACFALVATAEPGTNALKQELDKFGGTWRFESLEIEGTKMPVEPMKNARLTCDGDRFTYVENAQESKGTFKVDPAKSPKTIEITFTAGPNKGDRLSGIYEVEGDTYRVCLAMPGKTPPTEFASKPGSGHVLEVLKRERR